VTSRAVLGPEVMHSTTVAIHPLVIAGWCGLTTTAFNLMPVGCLDGGRAIQAAFGKAALMVSSLLTYLLLGLGVLGGPLSLPWGLYILIVQRSPEKPSLNDVTEVGAWRKAGLVFILLFALAMLLPLWDGLADELGIGPGTPLLWGSDCTKCSEILFLQQTWKSKGFIFHDCGRGLDLPILAMWDAMVLEQWDSGKPLLNVRTHNPSLSVRVAKVTSWVTHSLQSFHRFFIGLAFWHSRGLLLFRYLVHRFQLCHNEIFFAWSGLSNACGWSNCVPRVVWSGISSTHLVRFLALQSATLILRFFHCILFFEHWLCELEVKFGANDNEDLFYKICFYQITHFIW
jgi:hypothetical protein